MPVTPGNPIAHVVASDTNTGMGRPRLRRGPRGPFAEKLRAARASRGMTQAEAAADLGVERVTLSRWESGTHVPVGIIRRAAEDWIAKSNEGDRDAR